MHLAMGVGEGVGGGRGRLLLLTSVITTRGRIGVAPGYGEFRSGGGSEGGGGTGGPRGKGSKLLKVCRPQRNSVTCRGAVHRSAAQRSVGYSAHPNWWSTVCGAERQSGHVGESAHPTECW